MALSSTRVSTVIAAKPIASVTLTGSCMMMPAQAMLTVGNILEENGYYIGRDLTMEVAQREGIGRLLTI